MLLIWPLIIKLLWRQTACFKEEKQVLLPQQFQYIILISISTLSQVVSDTEYNILYPSSHIHSRQLFLIHSIGAIFYDSCSCGVAPTICIVIVLCLRLCCYHAQITALSDCVCVCNQLPIGASWGVILLTYLLTIFIQEYTLLGKGGFNRIKGVTKVNIIISSIYIELVSCG